MCCVIAFLLEPLDIFFSARLALFIHPVCWERLFYRGIALDRPETLSVSFEMVLLYTWVHGMVFCVIGGLASKLLALAERNLDLGFGIFVLFVIFEFGFARAAFIFASGTSRIDLASHTHWKSNGSCSYGGLFLESPP